MLKHLNAEYAGQNGGIAGGDHEAIRGAVDPRTEAYGKGTKDRTSSRDLAKRTKLLRKNQWSIPAK
jgi:hypothetical protein